MVNCQEFKQWLNKQDLTDENAFARVKDHFQVCRSCEELYQSDMALDAVIKKGLQATDPPPGIIARARNKIESESRPNTFSFLTGTWKTAVPALAIAALVLVMLLNPFSGNLQTVEEVFARSIANHLDTSLDMTFRTGEVNDVGLWFNQRLGYTVRLPDLQKLGLDLLGGRKCALGKTDAAFLFCNSKDKRVSLFVINQNDVGLRFDGDRKYTVEQGELKVTVWQDAGMVYAMVI